MIIFNWNSFQECLLKTFKFEKNAQIVCPNLYFAWKITKNLQKLSNSHHLTTLFLYSHWMTPFFGEYFFIERTPSFKMLSEHPCHIQSCPSQKICFACFCHILHLLIQYVAFLSFCCIRMAEVISSVFIYMNTQVSVCNWITHDCVSFLPGAYNDVLLYVTYSVGMGWISRLLIF